MNGKAAKQATNKVPANQATSAVSRKSPSISTASAAKPKPQRPAAKTSLTLADSKAKTKQALLIALMERSNGATLADLTQVTGWQSHSIRGVISGVLRKKQGLMITLTTNKAGNRVYRIGA